MVPKCFLASGAAWRPAGTEILGYNFRGMKIGGVESSSILSSHSAGLAIDIDAGQNGPKYDGGAKNRGNIPDGVVEALVRAGFVWGGVRKKGFEELGDDPMHFQLSLHPDDARYPETLASDATAEKYWDALEKQRLPIPPRS